MQSRDSHWLHIHVLFRIGCHESLNISSSPKFIGISYSFRLDKELSKKCWSNYTSGIIWIPFSRSVIAAARDFVVTFFRFISGPAQLLKHFCRGLKINFNLRQEWEKKKHYALSSGEMHDNTWYSSSMHWKLTMKIKGLLIYIFTLCHPTFKVSNFFRKQT